MRAPSPVDQLARDLAGPPRALRLEEWALVLGGLRHVELGLFERLGAASVAAPPPVASWAMGASFAAAWRGGQLESLMPVALGLPSRSEVSAPPSEQVAAGLLRLAELPADALAGEVASCWYPALIRSYETRAALLSAAGDGPHGVVLERVLGDLRTASVRVAGLLTVLVPAREGA